MKSVLLTLFALLVTILPLAAEPAYQETDGYVCVEVESEAVTGSWTSKTALSGYTGTAYYEWTGSNYFSSPGNGTIDYPIYINNSGNYQILVRNRICDESHGNTECNDSWVRMSGTPISGQWTIGTDVWTKSYNNGMGWRWQTSTKDNDPQPLRQYFSAGLHRISFSGRSANHGIDRFVLFKWEEKPWESAHNAASAYVSILDNLAQSPKTDGGGGAAISGELKKWHKITLDFEGPDTSETASTNPFTDYRLNVTFSNGGTTYIVPGYYAADGNAAETSAVSGDVWRCHFAPDKTGTWTYSASFRTGTNVAINDSASAGSSAGFCDGVSGSFSVSATDKTDRDHRGKGRLQYVGERYLQFAETGEYFVKGGADAPENFLAYDDFDNTPDNGGRRKDWAPHVQDWNTGDPTWKSGKGKGIIGAVNYLSETGCNVFSFLTMNINGDDKNVFPYISDGSSDRTRFDCSKLDQWEIVLEHGDKMGMYLHFKTQETENDQLLDGGAIGNQRKIYYRELIARFGHHLALNWNLGEENTQTEQQRKDMAQYFYDNDPYRHNVVLHTYPGQQESVYRPLLGSDSKLTGVSIQINWNQVHAETLQWVQESAASGKHWVVANDEQGGANTGVMPDANDSDHDGIRAQTLWGNLMAGGAGVEYYFGYSYAHSDLTCQDWRSRANMWAQTKYALDFFNTWLPFQNMNPDDSLVSASGAFCLAQPGQVYAVYLPNGGTSNLDLSGISADFTVKWYNPRTGGGLQNGSVTVINGPGTVSLGTPPSDSNEDWVVLIELSGSVTTYNLNVIDGSGDGDYPEGAEITITADTPAAGTMFSHWIGNTAYIADVNNPSTTVTMPNKDISANAEYTAATAQEVVSFTLINADTDQPVSGFNPIADGAIINLADTGSNLNIRANTNPSTVGSVRFGWDANSSYQTESAAPYAIAGDTSGDYNAWTPALGSHTLTGTPYTEASAGGTAGTVLSIAISVINDSGSSNTPPTVEAGPNRSITLPTNSLTLNATVTDPDETPGVIWTKVSGPGTVSFANARVIDAQVTFGSAGTYVLKLTANDGVNPDVTDTMQVIVYPDPDNDTDDDGLDDDWEMDEFDSLDATDGSGDEDLDGLNDAGEFLAGTDPHNSDSDDDGLDDNWEVENNLNPLDDADAGVDSDGDGLDNAAEYLAGTDPHDGDTDGDGMVDGFDPDPLNPGTLDDGIEESGCAVGQGSCNVILLAGLALALLYMKRSQ